MEWIALLPATEEEIRAWAWRALQFTPRVTRLDEAVLLEVSASLRLWGGRKRLLQQLLHDPPFGSVPWCAASTALRALALLRVRSGGEPQPRAADDLPLHVLTAAREHLATLERIGCRTWGELRRLPRAGVARRFGAPLLQALDAAYGERADSFEWLQLPETFDQRIELPALATHAPELLWSAQRLLLQLQAWLQARQQGVLALELEWTLDLRRLNGVHLPSHEQLTIRTAQPTQDTAHLRRLLNEHLARATLAAPANHLRLRSVQTVPWAGASKSLLPEENVPGEALHQFIERLSVRLGAEQVLCAQLHADHRPERMQTWVPAREAAADLLGRRNAAPRQAPLPADSIYPCWLLPAPRRLQVQGDQPQYHGPLRLLVGPQRLESGWWEAGEGGGAVRDYFIAGSEQDGLLWIYRERLNAGSDGDLQSDRWYLHGVYA